jgi:NAD(P)-dependent dehydrogenase (short-subunit alcohol dehydrogenase family)
MSEPCNSVAGKIALITGGSKRLGRAITLALAQQGAGIVVHYNQSEQAAETLCSELHDMGRSACKVQADLTDSDQTKALFEHAVSEAGPIDILINNASTFNKETIWETTEPSLSRNLQVHCLAPLILARALAKQDRPAQVVNLLDTRVTVYDREHASYHLSKRILLTLTRMLAFELAPAITVNAVAPGLILPPAGQDETYLQKLAHCNPLNRYGNAQDIADAVLFLLHARFITGQVIYVDGGYHMKGHMYD